MSTRDIEHWFLREVELCFRKFKNSKPPKYSGALAAVYDYVGFTSSCELRIFLAVVGACFEKLRGVQWTDSSMSNDQELK